METKTIRLLTKDDIEVKVKQITEKGALGLLYKTARVDRQILDDTYGAMNWQCKFEVINENLYCSIGVYNTDIKEWVWKSDCGVESETEAEKGEASDAFKRAGFKWGIGVELYNSPFIWLKVATKQEEKNGKMIWVLADKFQRFEVKDISIDDSREITKLVIIDAKTNQVVYSFGSDEKAIEPAKPANKSLDPNIKDPTSENHQSPEAKGAEALEALRKQVIDLGNTLDPNDRASADNWFFKTFQHGVVEMASEKELNIAKKVYNRAKDKEEEAKAKAQESKSADTIDIPDYVN